MSNKLKVDELPLTINGKTELVRQNQYAAHKATGFTASLKVNVTKKDVTDMIDMIVAGKELDQESPDNGVWIQVYEEVKADIELAQDKFEERVAEEERKKQEEAAAEKAKQDRALSLVTTASSVDKTLAFASLGEKFDLGANLNQCVPKEGTTVEDALTGLVASFNMAEFTNWAKGDLVAWLESKGEEQAMVILCQQTGIPYKSIWRMAATARAVPPEKRDPAVSFTTYSEIALADFSKEKKLIGDKAAEYNKATREELLAKVAPAPAKTGNEEADKAAKAQVITTALDARAAVAAAQGKVVIPPDPNAVDLEKHSFLVFDTEDKTVSFTKGFPKSLDKEGYIIVHEKTNRSAEGFGDDRKWIALPEHKEPAPVAATAPAAAAPAATPAAEPAKEEAKPAAKKKGKK